MSGESFSNVIGFTELMIKVKRVLSLQKMILLKSITGLKKIRKDNLGRNIQLLDVIKKQRMELILIYL